MPPLNPLPQGATVAVIRLRSLGDTLLMTPALAALKRWRGDLKIAVLVEPRFAAVLAGNPDVDRVIEVGPALPARLRALAELRGVHPAIAVGLHGGTTAAWLARASGARCRATFAGLWHPWAYNFFAPAVAPGQARPHTVEYAASLFQALGMPAAKLDGLRIFPLPEARARLRARLSELGVGEFAFLNTEAREPEMRWPSGNFGELAGRLRGEFGLQAVAASASGGEAIGGITRIAGTTVEDLIALEAEAAILIGNDGGPVHIAAALGKPVVAIYSSTDVPVWSPWRTPHRCLQADDLRSLSVERVVEATRELL